MWLLFRKLFNFAGAKKRKGNDRNAIEADPSHCHHTDWRIECITSTHLSRLFEIRTYDCHSECTIFYRPPPTHKHTHGQTTPVNLHTHTSHTYTHTPTHTHTCAHTHQHTQTNTCAQTEQCAANGWIAYCHNDFDITCQQRPLLESEWKAFWKENPIIHSVLSTSFQWQMLEQRSMESLP